MFRKEMVIVLVTAILIVGASSVWAQETKAEQKQESSSSALPLVTAGFAMAIAAAGCGYAQSKALTAACEGVSRNPGVADSIRTFIFLGLAFIEFLALLTFVVALMVYAK
jgi:F-type H+-transporting ATPase subunit c